MSLAVLCLMFLSTVQVAIFEECPEGWESYGTKCYKHSTSRATWHNAKVICESEGGTLANVADESINTHLQRYDNRDYWIGLRVTSDKFDWYWNDGSTFVDDKFKWDDGNGEPNGQHTCARLQSNDKLGDKECENPVVYFICQADSNPGSWSNIGGYWFFFSDETKNQYEASNYCINKGGYLARKDVFSALHQRVQSREYWIGLSRRYWLDGSLYLWNNFRPASLDSSSHCFFISNNLWEGESCSKETTTSSITTTSTTTSTTTATIISPSITQTSITTNVTPPPTVASNSNVPSFTHSAKNTGSATLWRSMDTSMFERMVTEYTTGGNEHQLSGTDAGVIALAVFGSIIVLTIGAVLIAMMILRRGNPFCKRRKGKETSAQLDYENVGDTVSNDNCCNRDEQHSTKVGSDNDTSARALSSNNNAVNYEDVHPIDTTYKENADYELIANQYEHIHIEQDNNVNNFSGYESLNNSKNVI